jgi:hypothetical protein
VGFHGIGSPEILPDSGVVYNTRKTLTEASEALLGYSYMPQSVKERVGKLREEIAEISEANRLYLQGGKKMIGASDQERRLQRLQEIMDELMSLTEWKKT